MAQGASTPKRLHWLWIRLKNLLKSLNNSRLKISKATFLNLSNECDDECLVKNEWLFNKSIMIIIMLSLSIIFVRFNPCWGSWDEKQTKLKVGIGVTWLCRWAENWLKLSCQTRQYETFPGFWVSKKKDSHIVWKRPKKSHFTMLTYKIKSILESLGAILPPFLALKFKVLKQGF